MNPTELRIGNYIETNKELGRIQTIVQSLANVGVSIGGIFDQHSNPKLINYNDCNPITLTEEWLLKLGFLKENSQWYNAYVMVDELPEGGFFYYGSYEAIVDLSYVHQLQNLAFVINGKDLSLTNL